MAHRLFGAALAALTAALIMAAGARVETRTQWISGEGYDWWPHCEEEPDDISFLPAYSINEAQTYVDLGRNIVLEDGRRLRALQTTRDKDFGDVNVVTGTWYAGMGIVEWPARTVDVRRQLEAFRVVSYEINGNRHSVPPCIQIHPTSDEVVGYYNAWVRFTEPGRYPVKITARQVFDFAFIFPFAQMGETDPLGLEGRRVFLRGETVGETLDGDIVHTYDLQVGYRDVR